MMKETKYITVFSNQNCIIMRGRCIPADEFAEDELKELKGNDDLTVWDAMTATDIRECAEVVPHYLRGGLDLALSTLPEEAQK